MYKVKASVFTEGALCWEDWSSRLFLHKPQRQLCALEPDSALIPIWEETSRFKLSTYFGIIKWINLYCCFSTCLQHWAAKQCIFSVYNKAKDKATLTEQKWRDMLKQRLL